MKIYIFRGLLGNFFSTGMDRLAKRLKAEGHEVSVHSWVSRKRVQKEALKTEGPIGIVGHSLGGNSANYMALYLRENGRTVAGLACVDATAPKAIYGIPGYAFRSNDIRDKSVPGLKTIHRDDLNHVQIDKDETVHDMISELFDDWD